MRGGSNFHEGKTPEDVARLEVAREIAAQLLVARETAKRDSEPALPEELATLLDDGWRPERLQATVISITEAPSYVSVPRLSEADWPDTDAHCYFSAPELDHTGPEPLDGLRSGTMPNSVILWEHTGAKAPYEPGSPIDLL